MASRYNEYLTPVYRSGLALRDMRKNGRVADDNMRSHLQVMQNALQDQEQAISQQDLVIAIYSLAVHNPWNEDYARDLGRIIVPLRDMHKYIAEALVLGRKATRDRMGNPDTTEDNQSPLQRHVTESVHRFLREKMLPEKKMREFLGDIQQAGTKLDEPISISYLHNLTKIYKSKEDIQPSTPLQNTSTPTSDRKLDHFKDTAMGLLGIDGLTPQGHRTLRATATYLKKRLALRNS